MAKRKTRVLRVSDVVSAMDRVAPFRLAESWDNVGLQFGDPEAPAGKIMVGLEVTRELLAEAAQKKIGTIVTHHPLLFRPPKSFAENAVVPRLAARLIRQNHALIAAHTNIDSVGYGTNGVLADLLDLQAAGRRFLVPAAPHEDNVKYAVFVPTSHVRQIIDAIAAAGAGVIGEYSHCTFRTPGTGTYIPLEGANPYQGARGKLEEAEEVRLECVCPKAKLGRLIAGVRAVHPYEEVAFDVFPLVPGPEPRAGLGLVGALKRPCSVSTLATRLKKALGIRTVGLVGDVQKRVETVAICTGGGGSLLRDWRCGTADVYITGEMTHHDCAEAHEMGLAVLLAGHYESEVIAAPRVGELLQMALAEMGFTKSTIVVSAEERNPLKRL